MTLQSSPLGRGGHRDDRRRRLLAEDLTVNYTPPVESQLGSRSESGGAHKSGHYGDAEFLENQLRLTDLVPKRLLTAILLGITGVVGIACIITLYVAVPSIVPAADCGLSLGGLGQPGSLGNWLVSLLLLAGSFFALIAYTIRRHKVDDYHGRYRVWFWAAGCWFVMACDVATGLHSTIQHTAVSLTHARIIGDGSIWWLAPSIFVAGWVGAWLVIDMQSSRLSSAAIILAAISYLTALTACSHAVPLSSEIVRYALVHIALMAGHLLLTWSMVLHARYVLLDAEGRLPRQAARASTKRKRTEQPRSKPRNSTAAENPQRELARDEASNGTESDIRETDETWVAIDPPHGNGRSSGPSVLKRSMVAPADTTHLADQEVVSESDFNNTSSSTTPDEPRLSKTERKALKKRQLEERLRSEQRKASNW